jgi:solute carrier family 25 thiamine pyrophosphate transporter 19
MEFWFGALAGLGSRLVVSPIDVVKIRLQVYGKINLRQLVKQEGMLCFWKGNLAASILYFIYGGTQFYCYERFKAVGSFQSGALAAFIATIVSYPFDLARTLLAVNRLNTASITHVLSRHLFRGIFPTLVSIVPQMGLIFYFNQALNNHIHFDNLNFKSIMCGGCSGIAAKAILMPLDVLKKRVQVGMSLSQILAMKNFYAGLVPTLLKSFMSTATSFLVYDQMKNRPA